MGRRRFIKLIAPGQAMLGFVVLTRLILAAGLVLLASEPATALDQVSMQLKWKHQFQFAGY